jgi:hypothetical protein
VVGHILMPMSAHMMVPTTVGDDVIVDELLPHKHGCSHEIVSLSGSLTITAADFATYWRLAECHTY